ncbi:MAG: hypothetical protein ACREXR_18245 [Gammaproteobacteria bacterium]
MTKKFLALLPLVCFANTGLIGCAPPQEPFMSVEICLKDAAGVAAFKQEMEAIARTHGIGVLDDSTSAESEVEAIATEEFRKKLGQPVVSMVVKHNDNVIAMVGNIGLPSGQVVLSFFDSSRFDSRRFADMVVDRLAKKWRIEVVPQGQGAQGIAGCS